MTSYHDCEKQQKAQTLSISMGRMLRLKLEVPSLNPCHDSCSPAKCTFSSLPPGFEWLKFSLIFTNMHFLYLIADRWTNSKSNETDLWSSCPCVLPMLSRAGCLTGLSTAGKMAALGVLLKTLIDSNLHSCRQTSHASLEWIMVSLPSNKSRQIYIIRHKDYEIRDTLSCLKEIPLYRDTLSCLKEIPLYSTHRYNINLNCIIKKNIIST